MCSPRWRSTETAGIDKGRRRCWRPARSSRHGGTPVSLWPREAVEDVQLDLTKLLVASASSPSVPTQRIGGGAPAASSASATRAAAAARRGEAAVEIGHAGGARRTASPFIGVQTPRCPGRARQGGGASIAAMASGWPMGLARACSWATGGGEMGHAFGFGPVR
jgi:hypothetical protein